MEIIGLNINQDNSGYMFFEEEGGEQKTIKPYNGSVAFPTAVDELNRNTAGMKTLGRRLEELKANPLARLNNIKPMRNLRDLLGSNRTEMQQTEALIEVCEAHEKQILIDLLGSGECYLES